MLQALQCLSLFSGFNYSECGTIARMLSYQVTKSKLKSKYLLKACNKRIRTIHYSVDTLPFDDSVSVIVLQAYAVVRFLFHYAIPVGCFVYCYGRIFQTIRRQSKVVGVGAGRSQSISMATMTRDRNMGQVQQLQATGATTGGKLSRTEMNVLQTMIAVIVCFMICFTVSAIENLLQPFGVSSVNRWQSIPSSLSSS